MGCRNAQEHFERIKYFHDTGGPFGYVPASYHYDKLAEAKDQVGPDSDIARQLYAEASKLMEVMKQRARGSQSDPAVES